MQETARVRGREKNNKIKYGKEKLKDGWKKYVDTTKFRRLGKGV